MAGSSHNAPHRRAASGSSVAESAVTGLALGLTSFVGREREIAELQALLADDRRLLTLTGPGGTGKTRLALEVVTRTVEHFEDGVWWLELAPISDPDLVPQAVASVLNLSESTGHSLTEVIIEDLRELEILLVLDNCEHLLDACARLAEVLLHACPGLVILATSREALGVAGERSFPVPPLSVPERSPAFEGLEEYEAVWLFVERAQDVAPGFELTEHNALAVAKLCRILDGIPLAIELAAARARVMSVEQISSRLEDSFDLLAGGSRTAEPRQRTLRAAIDWSYDLLPEEERVLFRRLSVFAGGFTLDATEAVCSGEDLEREEILELLSHLVEKSLVLVAEQGGEVRYRLLETVRQYGVEKLNESGEAERVRERHARYYLNLAEEAELEPEREARLEREHDNLRAALSWALGGTKTELGLGLAAALWSFWYTHGYLSEGRAFLDVAICRSGDTKTQAKARALNGAGYIALFQGEYEAARRFFERSLALYRRLGDEEGIASSLIYLGFVAVLSQRDLGMIPALYEEAASLGSEVKDRRVEGNLLIFSALSTISRGDLERGAILSEEGLALFREIHDVQGIGHSLNNLGLIAVMRHDYHSASKFLRENLRIAKESDYKLAIQYSLFGLGMVAAAGGQPARAARLWGAEEAMRESFGIQITPLARSTTNYDGYVATARSRLNESAFDTAWSEGRAMTPEQAVEYALTAVFISTGPRPGSRSDRTIRQHRQG